MTGAKREADHTERGKRMELARTATVAGKKEGKKSAVDKRWTEFYGNSKALKEEQLRQGGGQGEKTSISEDPTSCAKRSQGGKKIFISVSDSSRKEMVAGGKKKKQICRITGKKKKGNSQGR